MRLGEEVSLNQHGPSGWGYDRIVEHKLGHPTLTEGLPARMSGEVYFDQGSDAWIINNSSGRYSRDSIRTPEMLKNAAELFKISGLHVKTKFN